MSATLTSPVSPVAPSADSPSGPPAPPTPPPTDREMLGPEAAAILEFTTDVEQSNETGEPFYLMSKNAYVWAMAAVTIANKTKADQKRVEDIDIVAALYASISTSLIDIKSEGRLPHFYYSHAGLEFQRLTADNDIAAKVMMGFFDNLGMPRSTLPPDMNGPLQTGYRELTSKALVTDPIIETVLSVAVLGFVPVNFVKRTQYGQIVYRKLQASLWKYERERLAGEVTTSLTLDVAHIAKIIKKALIGGWDAATKGEGDEPPPPAATTPIRRPRSRTR